MGCLSKVRGRNGCVIDQIALIKLIVGLVVFDKGEVNFLQLRFGIIIIAVRNECNTLAMVVTLDYKWASTALPTILIEMVCPFQTPFVNHALLYHVGGGVCESLEKICC